MGYKSSYRTAWESSPIYHARKYRDPETIQKEEVMEDFLDWLAMDYETEVSPQQENVVKALIADYLGCDLGKVKAGEAEMLRLWTEEKPLKV